MDINEYQDLAWRTANKDLPYNAQLINAAFGLCGESGEFADILKKTHFQGHTPDIDHLIGELGDICWYIALAAKVLDVNLEDVMKRNIDKLRARYPDGFDLEKSKSRIPGDV